MCEKCMSCDLSDRGDKANRNNRTSSWFTTPLMVMVLCILKALTARGKTNGGRKTVGKLARINQSYKGRENID
jgi:hypothetical protein